jgi:hypothetical protein
MVNSLIQTDFSASAQHFLNRQIAYFQQARPGFLAGNELEFPVTYFEDVTTAQALALENAVTEYFIDQWNAQVHA